MAKVLFFLGYLKDTLVSAYHLPSFYHVISREVPIYSREKDSGMQMCKERLS